jgi:transposase InsO family protein
MARGGPKSVRPLHVAADGVLVSLASAGISLVLQGGSPEGIQHRTTKVRSPQTNGFVERMNRTLRRRSCFFLCPYMGRGADSLTSAIFLRLLRDGYALS